MNYKEAKEEIKNRISIVEVIKEYVPLKRSGSNWLGLCPFHSDKNPSMSVSEDKKIFKCFACKEGGDVFHFLEKYLNISYYEAVLKLAKQVNIDIDNDYTSSENYKKQEEKKQKLYSLHKDVANTYYKFLYSDIGKVAYEYLKVKRHLTDETILKFGLGYAPKDGDLLYNILKKKGYDDDILIESTLFKLNENNKLVNYFFDRVIFPVIDINKHIIGFQSRVLNPNQKEFKYLNSKTTMIFQKDSILFGYNFAFYSKRDYYIICEGNMDVISLHQSGYDNAVAAQGTAFNDKQIFLLKRKPKKIYLCQDMDEAGVAAKNHIADMLGKYNFETYMIDLAPAKDVDEFINDKSYGVNELKNRLSKPIPSVLYYISTAKNKLNLDDPYDFEKYINLVVDKLSSVENSILRENYIKKTAIQEKIDANKLNSLVNERIKGNSIKDVNYSNLKADSNDANNIVNHTSKFFKNESQFVYLCYMSPDYRERLSSIVEIDELNDDVCKILYKLYINGVKIDDVYNSLEEYGTNIVDEIKQILNSNYNYDNLLDEQKDDAFNQLIRKIKIYNLEHNSNKSLDNVFEINKNIREISNKSFL